MIEMKVDRQKVYQHISGDTATVLSEIVVMVKAVVLGVMSQLRETGVPDEYIAFLHNQMNLLMLTAISEGVNDSKEDPA